MNMLKRSLRTTIAFAAGAAMMASISASAMAETATVALETAHPANTCSISLNTSAFSFSNVSTWNGSAWSAVSVSGNVSGTMYSNGTPGDRSCDVTLSNGAFMDGTNTITFLDATALKINNGPVSSFSMPANDIPYAGLPFGTGPSTVAFSITGTPYLVPAGTYTSTVTITLTDITP